jgi:transmembrane sensor
MKASIAKQAAEWIARRDAGWDAAAQRDFAAWLAADPRHAAAWAEASATWDALAAPRTAGRGANLLARTAVHESRRRRRTAALAVGLVALLAVHAPWREPARTLPAPVVESTTIIRRPDRQVLPDGSSVELAAGASLEIDFSNLVRSVRLVRGEALFSVTPDPARPFVVAAGAVRVRAVGTQFVVGLAGEATAVLVTEGRVAVGREPEAEDATAPAPIEITAGRRLDLHGRETPAAAPRDVPAAEMARALAWRQHRVEFNSTPLAEAVAWINRDSAQQLTLADDATGRLCISGVYWTHDGAGFAHLLELSLGVRVRPGAHGELILQR